MRVNEKSFKKFLYDNWLTMLIALQPLLDALAFWTQNERGTAAGVIRLIIMIVVPIVMLIKLKGKRRLKLFIAFVVIGVFCLLHILNGIRVGNYVLVADLASMARVAQMPVLALCFMAYIVDESRAAQVERGLYIAAGILLLSLVLSYVTHTAVPTYSLSGIGISGWTIALNGNNASIIITVLVLFSVLSTLKEKPLYLTIILIIGGAIFLIANGTKACYLSLLLMCVCGTAMLILTWICGSRGQLKRDIIVAATLIIVAVLSVALYRYTPMAAERSNIYYSKVVHESYYETKYPTVYEEKNREAESDKSAEEKQNQQSKHPTVDEDKDPEVKPGNGKSADWNEYMNELYADYIPEDMRQHFGLERIMQAYEYTDDISILMDYRQLKRTFAKIVWDETDTITKIVGFQFYAMNTSPGNTYDLENDWTALWYYYGYLGFALYAGFLAYVLFAALRRLVLDFRGAVNMRNMIFAMLFVLQLGLAQFSGAVLRRPNVSIYLSLTAAMLYYINVTDFREKRKAMLDEEK